MAATSPGMPQIAEFPVTYARGWNLVSIPVGVNETDAMAVFGDASDSRNFVVIEAPEKAGGSEAKSLARSQVIRGPRAWLKFDQTATVTFRGVSVDEVNFDFTEDGWHLVGSPSCVLPVSVLEDHTGIVAGTVYGFNGAYYSPRVLEPGRGYWVRTRNGAEPLELSMSCTASRSLRISRSDNADSNAAGLPVADHGSGEFASIRFIDAAGYERTLYFGGELEKSIDPISFALPPVPPAGTFDVRFLDDGSLTEAKEATISIQAVAYPLRLEFVAATEVKGTTSDNDFELDVLVDGDVVETHFIASGTILELTSAPTALRLRSVVAEEALPESFKLTGAYPNPFQREAFVSFDLPEAGDVRLEVYDLLGRRVSVVSETLEAGPAQRIRVTASELSAGAYFYRLYAKMPSETAVASGRLTVVN